MCCPLQAAGKRFVQEIDRDPPSSLQQHFVYSQLAGVLFSFGNANRRLRSNLRGRCANQVASSNAAGSAQKRIRQSMETKAHGQAGERLGGWKPGCRAIQIVAFHASARRSVWSFTISRAHIGIESQLFLALFPCFFFFFILRSP